jgi:ABC-type transport system involved in multi-copper enzyme maturation permease subunit
MSQDNLPTVGPLKRLTINGIALICVLVILGLGLMITSSIRPPGIIGLLVTAALIAILIFAGLRVSLLVSVRLGITEHEWRSVWNWEAWLARYKSQREFIDKAAALMDFSEDCSYCGGTGQRDGKVCTYCEGSGKGRPGI